MMQSISCKESQSFVSRSGFDSWWPLESRITAYTDRTIVNQLTLCLHNHLYDLPRKNQSRSITPWGRTVLLLRISVYSASCTKRSMKRGKWDYTFSTTDFEDSGLILGLRTANFEMALLCNDVSHWLGANIKSTLRLNTAYRNIVIVFYGWIKTNIEVERLDNLSDYIVQLCVDV